MRRICSAVFRFSSGHSHDHTISLNLKQTWVANPSNTKLLGITGFQDLKYHHHEDNTNPYQHLVEAPFFSFERWYFNDPYHHKEEDDPMCNPPHGYLLSDDPLSTKNNIEVPGLEIFVWSLAAVFFGIVLGQNGLVGQSKGESAFQAHLTRSLMEDEIKKIRIENKALEDRLETLQKQVRKIKK